MEDLLEAVREGRMETVRALIAGGTDLNRCDACGKTALMIAACRGLTEVAKALIAAGADLNATDHNGNTALIYATYFSQLAPASRWVAIALALASAGADPDAEGGFKRMSARAWARELGQKELISFLDAPAARE